ncbi:MAG: glycerophosphodiester phosphodiesterase [Methylococcaceae bacterium]|jgi:glycerophosphoryl diester phosphodiesterase
MLNQFYKPTVLATAMLAILGVQNSANALPHREHNEHMTRRPIVIGHRGAAGYRPEHTIEGYTLAIEMGADFIEPDLVLTKDGHMIARHEPMIGGTTDVASHPEFAGRKTKRMVDGVEYNDWFASDFTLAEFKTLHAIQARADRDQQYNGLFQIPTLDEVIALAKSKSKATGRTIGIYPEIKHSTYHANVKDANDHPLFGLNFFENKLLKKLHKAYGNSACAPVFIQSFEVSNLQYLSHKTDIQLVQLIDADDVNADGSISLVAPYKQPYDFVLKGNQRTFADLLSDEGLDFVKSYADAVGPWKPYLVKTVADNTDRNGDGKITINDRRVEGSTGVVEMAHDKGLLVHTWTFRNDASGYGFADPKQEMTYYFDLGVDGLFTDFADTGVEARDASINADIISANNQCKAHTDEQENEHEDQDGRHDR